MIAQKSMRSIVYHPFRKEWYIINFEKVVYHQNEVLYIIIAKA